MVGELEGNDVTSGPTTSASGASIGLTELGGQSGSLFYLKAGAGHTSGMGPGRKASGKRGRRRSAQRMRGSSKKRRMRFKQSGEIRPGASRKTCADYQRDKDVPERQKLVSESASGSSGDEEENPYTQLLSLVSVPKVDDYVSDDGASKESDEEEVFSEGEKISAVSDMDSESVEGSDDATNKESDWEADGISEDEDNESNMDPNCEEAEEELAGDPFHIHFEREISDDFVKELTSEHAWKTETIMIPQIGKGVLSWPNDKYRSKPLRKTEKDLTKLHVKQVLCKQVSATNKALCDVDVDGFLSPFQNELFEAIKNYQDFYYPERNLLHTEQTRLVYCLHALNHVLKTRTRVLNHNTKLKSGQHDETQSSDDFRDQGLTRPKVLIVVPFRESAKRIVQMLIHLLMPKQDVLVSNKKRFLAEYSLQEEEKKPRKPEDYLSIFAGNIDDHFRIGLGVAKKTLKLYTKFYSSDIILASPLGLRTTIDGTGPKSEDCDFLSSIELLIIDQADVCLMQNWDHIKYMMSHMHLQPKDSHGVDFSRVRMWTINGWSKYYRQTLIFSAVPSPEINSLFNKCCFNYTGKIRLYQKQSNGSICQIITQLPVVFHRIDCPNGYSQAVEDRFDFFIKKIVPHHQDSVMAQTLIFIPSYLDFVRIRNYFTRKELNFAHINEYSSKKSISRNRNEFIQKKIHFLLYTERLHFYHRFRIQGICHIIFYELPHYSHYFSEICNLLPNRKQNGQDFTCSVIYSKYDVQKLASVVGTDRATCMVSAAKSVHMFVTGS